MKHVLTTSALMVSLAALTSVAHADSGLAGSIAVTSDYVWRGISQSSEDPALQAGLTYTHDSGFYAGLWTSNVYWGPGAGANIEVDINGGLTGQLDNGIGWDVGAVYYTYPTSSGNAAGLKYDTIELYAGASYSIFSAKYSYTNDYFGSNKSADYLEGAVKFELPEGFGLGLHVGHSGGDAFAAGADYNDYKVALTKDVMGFGVELGYTDSDFSPSKTSGPNANDGRFILTVSRAF